MLGRPGCLRLRAERIRQDSFEFFRRKKYRAFSCRCFHRPELRLGVLTAAFYLEVAEPLAIRHPAELAHCVPAQTGLGENTLDRQLAGVVGCVCFLLSESNGGA